MTELDHISTAPPDDANMEWCMSELERLKNRLFELQNQFFADGRFALLIILQGMDTSGKDGTIRHVMTSMNPMGVNVKSFKKPTELEQRHDFLWRVYPHIPEKGMIQVFNRSYYEDIIIPTVEKDISDEKIDHRIDLINQLEEHWNQNDIHLLKFYLHISHDEQIMRVQSRKEKPHKMWKYDEEDELISSKWTLYHSAYQKVLDECDHVPWAIIPADQKWYRNYLIANSIVQKLETLDVHYPKSKSHI